VITKTPGYAWHDQQKRVEATLQASATARPQPASEQTQPVHGSDARRTLTPSLRRYDARAETRYKLTATHSSF